MNIRLFPILPALLLALLLGLAAPAGAATWETLTTENGLPNDEIQFLHEDAKGAVWIGTLGGLARYRDGQLETILEKGQIWQVLRLQDGRIMVGTNSGVLILPENPEAESEPVRGLKNNTVSPIVPLENGRVWALRKDRGTEENELMAWKGGETWEPVEALQGKRVVDLIRARDGAVWAAIEGDGVVEVSDPVGAPEQATHHLEGLNLTTLAEDGQGRLWCGVWQRGLMVHEGGQWHRHLGQEDSYIFNITDAEGTLWVGTSANGLWRYDGKRWENELSEEGAVNTLVWTPQAERVWISTQQQGGLRYWEDGEWITALEGPLPVRTVIERANGEIWAGGVLDGVHIKR